MYPALLHTHNVMRWLVLVAALVTLVLVYRGLFTRKAWTQTETRAGLAFVGLLDLQLIIGLVLYFVSPIVQTALGGFGAAMRDSTMRFFAVEHSSIMILAVVLAHVGSVMVKRTDTSALKFRRAAIWYTLSVLAILLPFPGGARSFQASNTTSHSRLSSCLVLSGTRSV